MIAPGIWPLFDLHRVCGAGSGDDDPICCGRAGGEVEVSARDRDNHIRSRPVGSVRDGLAMGDDWPWGMDGLAPAFMMHDSEENSETCWNREQQPVNQSAPSLDRPTTPVSAGPAHGAPGHCFASFPDAPPPVCAGYLLMFAIGQRVTISTSMVCATRLPSTSQSTWGVQRCMADRIAYGACGAHSWDSIEIARGGGRHTSTRIREKFATAINCSPRAFSFCPSNTD